MADSAAQSELCSAASLADSFAHSELCAELTETDRTDAMQMISNQLKVP